MERAIFIGRFQPFHKGHLGVIEEMDKAEGFDEIVIGVGSSQYSHYLNNPFTFEERVAMIEKSLHLRKPHQICAIPDINNFPKWVGHVESCCPKFQIIYSGNPVVRSLFEEKDYEVRDVNSVHQICATEIRKMMIAGKDWQFHLPGRTIDVINQIKGSQRLRDIYCEFMQPSVASDIIINYRGEGVVLIKRRAGENKVFGGRWAIPGGHLETGLENGLQAAIREGFEETNLVLDPRKVHFLGEYSNPGRDPRQHMVSLVYETRVEEGDLQAKDDAVEIRVCPFKDLLAEDLAFDHNVMIKDYLERGLARTCI